MVQVLNGVWNQEAQPFEIRTNGRHFVKNHLKSGQKRSDFEWLIAKARPFETRTIWNATFKKSGFQMVGFQIPTVFGSQHMIMKKNCSSSLQFLFSLSFIIFAALLLPLNLAARLLLLTFYPLWLVRTRLVLFLFVLNMCILEEIIGFCFKKYNHSNSTKQIIIVPIWKMELKNLSLQGNNISQNGSIKPLFLLSLCNDMIWYLFNLLSHNLLLL